MEGTRAGKDPNEGVPRRIADKIASKEILKGATAVEKEGPTEKKAKAARSVADKTGWEFCSRFFDRLAKAALDDVSKKTEQVMERREKEIVNNWEELCERLHGKTISLIAKKP